MDEYDWADQERLVQQDVEELDKLDRMRKRRKLLAEEYRERKFEDERTDISYKTESRNDRNEFRCFRGTVG